MMQQRTDSDNSEPRAEEPGPLPSPGAADASLAAMGWERRFVADAQRATEMIELYRKLGFEARAEPVSPGTDISPDCEDCVIVAQFKYKTIYTRKRSV